MKHKMKTLFKRVIATACAVSMVLGGMLSDLGTVTVKAAGEHTLWLVGDSTVCAFSDPYYYPRFGYGTKIGDYVDENAFTVKNLAASGTSSKSFPSEKPASYSELTGGIKEGDVLVIGFGHNDEKSEDEARYTNPNGDWQTEGSFAKSLYDNYVSVAQAVNAEVILCTPIVRRTTGSAFSNSQLHITEDKNGHEGGNYPEAIRQLGKDKNVPVVDLTELTKDLYTTLTPAETLYLHAWTSSKEGSVDNTHLNEYGAMRVAWLFADAVRASNATSLAAHVKEPEKPWDRATQLKSNPSYTEPEYDSNLPDSTLWQDYVVGEGDDAVRFKGTAFGNLGGAKNLTKDNIYIGSDDAGNMRVAITNTSVGKIEGSSDGLAMYYYKVPVGSQFTLSAKATINSLNDHSQAAFGLMARDDMYIDKNDTAVKSDYVVAGTLGTGVNCYYRHNGTLGGRAAFTKGTTLAAGASYDLKIESNSDGYTCTFGSETPQSQGYDFMLNSVDSEYVFVGMFATRGMDISFSNIRLEVIADTSKESFAVTVNSGEGGTASANKETAAEGETVTLTATPDSGYLFKEWKVITPTDLVIDENNQFTMPKEDVEVTAVFEAAEVAFATAPYITSNGNLNTPYPGNTLTVNYSLGETNDANDVSLIQWYSVKDGVETLVKTSKATEDKTYKITSEDVGSQIKVVVTPTTVGGNTGEAASCIMEEKVRDGYEDPGVPGGPDDPGKPGPDKPDDPDEPGEGLKVKLAGDGEYTYTGSAIKPAIVVTNNGEELTEGVGYTVKYKNNVKAGEKGDIKKSPSITVTGKGNLTGSETITFTIKRKSIKDPDVTIVDPLVIAQNTKAVPVIYYNGIKLGAKDYKLSENGKFTTTGLQKLTITGEGNYTDEMVIDVEVKSKGDLKKLTADMTKVEFGYDGTEKTLTVTQPDGEKADKNGITVYEKGKKDNILKEDEDFTVVYSNCVDAGTVKVTVVGQGDYTGSNVTKSYKINPIKGAETEFDAVIVDEDGNEIASPSFEFRSTGVTLGDQLKVYFKKADPDGGNPDLITLTADKDYKVSYSGNKKVGTAKYNITFLGNYKGSKAVKGKTFTINPAPLNQAMVEAEQLRIVSPDKVSNGKPNTYASKPYVEIDGVVIKASNYTVKYFRNYDGTQLTGEIDKNSKLGSSEGDFDENGIATVYVQVTGKGNYAPTADSTDTYAVGSYQVRQDVDPKTQDLSKAKVTLSFKDDVKKPEYTGDAIEAASVTVTLKGAPVNSEAYDVVYVNNVNKGKATVVITAKKGSGYGGSKVATFSIVSKSLKNLFK